MATNSFSRLGSANTYDNALRNISQRQAALSGMQENLTSGKKVVRASDDPTGAAQAERALTRISRIATDQRALESQKNAITMAESTLGDVTDAMQQFRELVVSAGNGTHSAAERKTIAIQLTGLRDQIFSLANRKDTNGLPLFSALGSALAPFVGPQATPPDYTFDGLPGQPASNEVSIPFALDGDSAFMFQPADGVYTQAVNLAAVPAGRTLTAGPVTVNDATLLTGSAYEVKFTYVGPGLSGVPGSATATYDITELPPFANPPFTPSIGNVVPDFPYGSPVTLPITINDPTTGNPILSFNITGTPAQDDTVAMTPSPSSLFSVLDEAIRDIGGATTGTSASQAVSRALGNIDIGMGRVSAVRGQAGDLLNRADRISANQDKRSIQLEADRSRAEDLDMVKGISDFQNQQTGYQAALQSYAQVQKLSLFNYIG